VDKALKLFKNHHFFKSEALNEAKSRETSLRHILRGKKQQMAPETLSRRALLKEIDDTLSELRYARALFESAYEPEIVEACVYKIKSAEARYNYLLRKAKETNTARTSLEL